jgi:hypothetical protein
MLVILLQKVQLTVLRQKIGTTEPNFADDALKLREVFHGNRLTMKRKKNYHTLRLRNILKSTVLTKF